MRRVRFNCGRGMDSRCLVGMKRGCLRHAADLKRGNIERVREMRDKKRKKVKLYDRWSRKLREKKGEEKRKAFSVRPD